MIQKQYFCNALFVFWSLIAACSGGGDETGDAQNNSSHSDGDSDADSDSDADGDGDSDTDGDGDTDSDAVPSAICDEPAPWPVPDAATTVGNGTPASCTESALRDAVNGGGYVTFNCGSDNLVIAISNEIVAGSQTVVDGENGNITLDGGGTNRIFVAPNHASLSVRNLRFINGAAPPSREADGIGGAVAGNWRSKVEVRNCVFENNTAGRGGGAVSVWTGSDLVVTGSRFVRNRSFYGGALYSLLSSLHIANSLFDDNETVDDEWGEGGAIGTDGASEDPDGAPGGTVEICGTRITNNRGVHSGGGAYVWVYPPDRVIIDRVTLSANHVGDGGLGGAMRISNGEIVIRASSFLSNESENHGGALYLDCAPTCTITNTTFFDNRAATYGGAISCGGGVSANNVTFASNSAGGHGGALFGGGYTVRNSIFVDNSAGNPWNQAYSCGETGAGDHVLQWRSDRGDAGIDPCVSDPLAADPLLDIPKDNGGPTFTMMPGVDSPVLSAGTGCEPVDQRGETRNVDACDLGAVERF